MTTDERRAAIRKAQQVLQGAEGWDWIVPPVKSHLARMADHLDDAPSERARMARGLLGMFEGDRSFRDTSYARELRTAARIFGRD